MRIIGISSGHDAGAAIIEDGKIIVAVNEERLNRKKLYSGVPMLSIKECLRLACLNPKDIDLVAFSNIGSSGGFKFQKNYRAGKLTFMKILVDFFSYFRLMDKKFFKSIYLKILSIFRNENEVIEFLRSIDIEVPYQYIEHHSCHAANAYYTSQYNLNDKVLIVTTDGSGDGLCATISTVDKNGFILRKNETTTFHSPASSFYSNITYNLGFKPLRHEGKITGLAAYGNPEKTLPIFRKYLTVDIDKLEYRSNLGCYGRPAAKKLNRLLKKYKREDIAAGLQKRIEEVTSALIYYAAKKYNCDKVCLSGGLFANVRLNQAIIELDNIKDIYIHPHMGDGGIAAGAALFLWAKKQKKSFPHKLTNVYLGPSFTNKEIESELKKNKLDYEYFDNIEFKIAEYLKNEKVIARFNGKMEYGPRALCNRSILYQATDPTINDWLNERLHRTEFMPFAPVVLFDKAGEYFKNFDPEHSFASEFMTITYDATDKCKKLAPAVVHVDGTARPQTVRKEINPSVYNVISEYEKLTGSAIIINTSFNMHEEPIVCTPSDAIRSFQDGNLDVLVIGNYVVCNK